MDLLDALLAGAQEDARSRLLTALDRHSPLLDEVAFNIFEVQFDREQQQVRIYDVLDGDSQPTVLTFEELRTRLG